MNDGQLMAKTERKKEGESIYIHALIMNSPTHLYRAELKVRPHLLYICYVHFGITRRQVQCLEFVSKCVVY